MQSGLQHQAHLLGRVGQAQVVGSVAVEVVEHLIGQRHGERLSLSHDAQALASHHILVAEHPRQQASVRQAVPGVLCRLSVAKVVNDLFQRRRRSFRQERYIGVYLEHGLDDGLACLLWI